MSVNKQKKSAEKSEKNKKSFESKAIEEAVKNIPSMIMGETYKRSKAEATTIVHADITVDTPISKKTQHTTVPVYEPPQGSRAWLWTGVIIFIGVIITLWILNMGTLLYQTEKDRDPAEKIIETSKQDLRAIIETMGKKEQSIIPTTTTATTQTYLDEIEKMLEKTVHDLSLTSTTISSTEFASSSIQ